MSITRVVLSELGTAFLHMLINHYSLKDTLILMLPSYSKS